MKRQFAVALVLLAAACAGVPARDYANASKTYNATLEGLIAFRTAGKIDDESYRRISPVIHAVDAALDTWGAAIRAADPSTGKVDVPRAVVTAVLNGLNELVIWQAKFAASKKEP